MTPKQERFVQEYLIDLNATQAAIRAGYAESGARQEGARLLSNADIVDAIATLKAKRAEETAIDARWVLKRLAAEVEADLSDLYTEGGSLRPVHEWPLIWRQGLVAGIDTIRGGEDGDTVDKIKLSDRARRLELLGKHVDVQAFKEKVEHDVSDDLVERLQRARERTLGNGS